MSLLSKLAEFYFFSIRIRPINYSIYRFSLYLLSINYIFTVLIPPRSQILLLTSHLHTRTRTTHKRSAHIRRRIVNASKRENRKLVARVVIVAEQVSRIISLRGGNLGRKKGADESCRITISAVIKPVHAPEQRRFTRARDLSTERTCQQREQRGRSREQREHLARSG